MTFVRPFDIFLLIVIAAAAIGAFFTTEKGAGAKADIYVNNHKVAHLDLSQPVGSKEIATSIGKVRINFGDGSIQVTHSPCIQKLCIRQGAISQTSQHIICLPAQLQIVIIDDTQTSKPADDLDAISY